jgi:hypothetical protein
VLDAGAELRRAQEAALGGGSGGELRAAGTAEREAVGRAVEAAKELLGEQAGKANLDRVRNSLHAAAGDEDVRAAIEEGRLTADHEPVGLGPLGAAGGAPKRRPARQAKQPAAVRKRLRDAEVADREASKRLDAARRELDRCRDAATRAQERLAAAQRDVETAEREAEAATGELAKARREA